MNNKKSKIVTHIFTPLRDFFKDSRAGGILLICCTALSLILSNINATSDWYLGLWKIEFTIPVNWLHFPESSLLFINDVLMTFFFFLVGMEIKRELTIGELASVKKSLLPVLAALGGMICPAIIFSLFNGNTPYAKGWGIPMATDIAFSLGILSLLGDKVPVQLKIFLAALAIIDDLGAIITIAVFYTASFNMVYFGLALVLILGLVFINKVNIKSMSLYLLIGVLLWYCLFNSGIHATIAGVIMAFAMPLDQIARVEHKLFHPVNFFIMPLFALANTGIVLPNSFQNIYTSTISFGVIAGLVIGKPLGIFLFSFLAVKSKVASLPSNSKWSQLFGIGLLGGIGFTMSIFTASLSYADVQLLVIAKVAIIVASVTSSVIGFMYLNAFRQKGSLSNEPVHEFSSSVENFENFPPEISQIVPQ